MCHGAGMDMDSDRFWQAIEAKDPRFDGWVFCGVKTTGIYCRPSCPGAHAQARERALLRAPPQRRRRPGFRACKRCRPDATPGLARVGPARGPRRARDAPDRRRRGRPRGRRRARASPRLHRAPRPPPARRGRRRGAARARPRPARADRAHPARDDRAADHRRRVRRRLSERAPVQRDDPGGVRADAERAARARAARSAVRRTAARCRCDCPTARRSTAPA